MEQRVPEALEWDGVDDRCVHAIAWTFDGIPIGTGRLTDQGQIGRIAVVSTWRRRGVGGALLEHLTAVARERGHLECFLHSQAHAVRFYEGHGFAAYGETFIEANIFHQFMSMRLKDPTA